MFNLGKGTVYLLHQEMGWQYECHLTSNNSKGFINTVNVLICDDQYTQGISIYSSLKGEAGLRAL